VKPEKKIVFHNYADPTAQKPLPRPAQKIDEEISDHFQNDYENDKENLHASVEEEIRRSQISRSTVNNEVVEGSRGGLGRSQDFPPADISSFAADRPYAHQRISNDAIQIMNDALLEDSVEMPGPAENPITVIKEI
jgi:hypothetical protein